MKLSLAFVLEQGDTQGGMERQAFRLARGLAERGARVTIVTTYMPPGLGLPLPARPLRHERRDGFEIVRVPCFRWWSGEAVRALVALVLARVLLSRRRAVDVIYAVQYQSASYAVSVAPLRDWPTVLKLACGGEYGDMSQVARTPDPEAVLEALRRVERYACLSQEVRAEVEAAGLDPGRCVLVRNGVDLGTFSPDGPRASLPPGRTILFVGRHHSQKRIDVLLRAFARIAPRVPDARLACVGRGPEAEGLQALARELGIAERVSFLGERRDVPDLLRAASVFVLPSAAEGLPNSLLEALASGKPAVVTDIPGTNEVVRHEQEALMVPLDDVAALSTALERLLVDHALAERLARAGRAMIERDYDMEKIVDAHVALFLAAKRPRRRLDRRRLEALERSFVRALAVGWFYAAARRL